MTASPLAVEGLRKRFGGVVALDDASLSLGQGEVLGLLGPNGSGKTTLVNCLSGVLVPEDGSIKLHGSEISEWSRARRARHGMVRTYQSLRLFAEMSVAENISVGLSPRTGLSRAERLELVRESVRAHGLESVRRVAVKNLSYGQQRLVEIARALVADPKVLLLDEPAAGLGEGDTAELAGAISAARDQRGCAVVLIDHDVSFVAGVSDRLAVLHKGQVVRIGQPAEIQRDPFVAQIYLGDPAEDLGDEGDDR